MEIIVKMEAAGALSSFTSEKGETIQKLDVQISQGKNRFMATAFDKVALELSQNAPVLNAIYVADLSFSVSGRDKAFQNVRLNSLVPLF